MSYKIKTETKKTLKGKQKFWVEYGFGKKTLPFHNLMRFRIRDILLVSSLYDLYLFEEDGRLYELLRHEYRDLQLSHTPELTRVSTARKALQLIKEEKRFDLIITTLHIEDMEAIRFAEMVRESHFDIPIVLLTHNKRELEHLKTSNKLKVFEKVFMWQGDFRLIIGIVKYLEDKLNIDHDTRIVGVQNIILIEDDVQYYSSFLPLLYTELFNQSHRLISEGVNLTHRYLRMRARPKILLCTTYEEAWSYFKLYKENCLGVISDVDFPRKGVNDPRAGVKFARAVKRELPDIPVLLLSNEESNREEAYKAKCAFILKDSMTLLEELRQFMFEYFSFGDFIFRTQDGKEVGRAHDLTSLQKLLKVVPDESIVYHAQRNHFSNWLKARTEFRLAEYLRPRKVEDYKTITDLRNDLINSIEKYKQLRQRGVITYFDKETFNPERSIARIGGGSLGGKARGLGFLNTLLSDYELENKFEGVEIFVPPAVIIATEVFDQFLDQNHLRRFAIECKDDMEITRRFLKAEHFPTEIISELANFLDVIKTPLAVRSSSLLEDSQYHPFAGIYETYMLPNNNSNPLIRLNELLITIKKVYASTFYQRAKEYVRMTSYRLEEEKMAVIVQKLIGKKHEDRFYPDISGVAKSYNFYPIKPQKPQDGIAGVALGLGKTVVDGGKCVRFCPRYPMDIFQFYSIKESLENAQTEFFALNLNKEVNFEEETHDLLIESYTLDVAEKDGTLNYVGSTYSPENDIIYDGIARSGMRLVTMAPILRHKIFPLPDILNLLLNLGTWGMGTPVEIEFAANLKNSGYPKNEFGIVQLRPIVIQEELDNLKIENVEKSELLCESDQVLGHGVINDIRDIIMVDKKDFQRAKSAETALEISQYNTKLNSENTPYLLIGMGRWGSLDPWLGIPVVWEQISGAKVIIETDFEDMSVQPSQGTHFFHNITSLMVGYFTVHTLNNNSFLDWEWLENIEPVDRKTYTKHLHFKNPLTVKINGRKNHGIIIKPKANENDS